MALSGRTRLGPYEILAPLGAGGMGEVYRAKDTRLDRTVAIKVLPSHLSASPELRRRLEREAKAISQLSHPHICTLHDVGREGETDFLVMEYLEGDTLAHRLEKGPLSLEQALRTASEIADALDKAHRQGVVHRDLKPGNVMLTKTGAKLLDFGLAKLRDAEPVEEVVAESALPTEARPLTEEGKIIGTYPYMAPEQLEGAKADARTDIFAFGAVLYEMVTGQRAFEGKSRASLIAAILSSEPRPISELQPMTPSAVEHVVHRCLVKDPDDRWQSAGDLAAELRWIAEGGAALGGAPGSTPSWQRRDLAWALFVMAAAGLTAVSTALYFRATRPEEGRFAAHAPSRFVISVPPSQRIPLDWDDALSLSPDGRMLAWTGGPPERRRLFVRPLDSLEVREIPGTEDVGGGRPVFSPNGDRILFLRDGALWSVKLDGGIPTRLLETDSTYGVSGSDWIDEETLIIALAYTELHRMPAGGGKLEPVTALDEARGEVAHFKPHVLPGGRAALFSVGIGTYWNAHIEVVSLETGERHTIIKKALEAQYAPSGHVLFGRDGTLFAVPFDLERLEVVGPEVAVLAPVQMDTVGGEGAHFALSGTGTLAYVPGDQGLGERQLEWWYRDGRIEPLPAQPGYYWLPRLSPDGRRLAVVVREGDRRRLHLYELDRHILTPLEREGDSTSSAWSPDGSRLAFTSDRSGPWNLFVKTIGDSAEAVQLQKSEDIQDAGSWSADGSLLAYVVSRKNEFDVFLLPMNGSSAEPIPFLASRFAESHPAFSPDGRWLAYVSDETGQPEIFVREVLPDDLSAGARIKVSRDGGTDPVWARDGSELFYRSVDGSRILAVTTQPGPQPVFDSERELLSGLRLRRHEWWPIHSFEVAPHGDRFLVNSYSRDPDSPMQLVVALDWAQQLERLAPRSQQ